MKKIKISFKFEFKYQETDLIASATIKAHCHYVNQKWLVWAGDKRTQTADICHGVSHHLSSLSD